MTVEVTVKIELDDEHDEEAIAEAMASLEQDLTRAGYDIQEMHQTDHLQDTRPETHYEEEH